MKIGDCKMEMQITPARPTASLKHLSQAGGPRPKASKAEGGQMTDYGGEMWDGEAGACQRDGRRLYEQRDQMSDMG